MAKNLGKWPSGHGQLTKMRLSDSCGGKTIKRASHFGYDRMDLKAIWEMSDISGMTLRQEFLCRK